MSFEDGVCLKKKGSSNGQRFLISTNDIGPMLKAPLSNLSKIVPLACPSPGGLAKVTSTSKSQRSSFSAKGRKLTRH